VVLAAAPNGQEPSRQLTGVEASRAERQREPGGAGRVGGASGPVGPPETADNLVTAAGEQANVTLCAPAKIANAADARGRANTSVR
jgi:hypothetical protein